MNTFLILVISLFNLPQESVYLTDRGQNINKRPNIVYVSTDGGTDWMPLYTFVDVNIAFVLCIFSFLYIMFSLLHGVSMNVAV